ncbi:MAG: hypothetical protein IT458_03175 [Planctomycetes bacterium]|nr:hypothetical protein [Planctomycetota bacterium]
MNRPLTVILSGAACALLGLAGGWYAARQGGQAAAGGAAAEEAQAHDTELSAQTLANLGVRIEPLAKRTFVRTVPIQAVIHESPLARRPVVAPFGGVVRAVRAEPGQVIEEGGEIVTLVRDAIPRPRLQWTGTLLDPGSGSAAEAAAALRAALVQERVARREVERVRGLRSASRPDELPLVARRDELQLEYELERAVAAVQAARDALERRGLSAEHLAALEAGGGLPPGRVLWRGALGRQGLWNEHAEQALDLLPAATRAEAATVGLLGELVGAGLAQPSLVATLREVPGLGAHFGEAAALLLEGETLEHVRGLAVAGGLEPVLSLRAPERPEGTPDWELLEVAVRAGQRVERGQTVAVLRDGWNMHLELLPVGSEVRAVLEAARSAVAFSAEPLLGGTGPAFADLRIERITSEEDDPGESALLHAHVPVRNAPLVEGAALRSWALRTGTRYRAYLPVSTLPDRFVLPRDAVAEDGPDRVVFLRDGCSFRRQPVHVEHEDHEVVVVADDGALFPGDHVVVSAAFALRQALEAGKGDAAHTHDH